MTTSTGKKTNHVKHVKYFKGEIINIFDIFREINFDYVFHFGEYSRVEQSFEEIDKIIKYNVIPLFEVIKLFKKNNSKLIYSGSSTKFSNYSTGDIISPYAWSKKITLIS